MRNNYGMDELVSEIREFIENKLNQGYKKFIIFPFGDVGIRVKHLLNSAYGIQEDYILDNHLCLYNSEIRPLSYMAKVKHEDYAVLLSSTNPSIYKELKTNLLSYFSLEQISELSSMKSSLLFSQPHTTIGKHSYGPICRNHDWIESIGSFCSFAKGVDVVLNHERKFLTTSPMIYMGQMYENFEIDPHMYESESWYVKGMRPHKEKITKIKRIRIGNDVWLGTNVTITNSSNIGNGVIAGAGAVITHDVPDYAVVVGVPARIIKYRYLPEQIKMLNQIEWWNWTDEEINERFDDFYLPVDEFIHKYI